jgi:hypothetical protein
LRFLGVVGVDSACSASGLGPRAAAADADLELAAAPAKPAKKRTAKPKLKAAAA